MTKKRAERLTVHEMRSVGESGGKVSYGALQNNETGDHRGTRHRRSGLDAMVPRSLQAQLLANIKGERLAMCALPRRQTPSNSP